MTSLLSSGTTRRQSPAYCKKGKFTGIDPTINGLPAVMNAYAAYLWIATGIQIDANELIHLRRDQPNARWVGSVDDGTDRLEAELIDPPSGSTYTMRLTLYINGAPVAASSWDHVQPPRATRWDTGPRFHIADPGTNESALHIMG